MSADTERRARLALSFLGAPGDSVLGAALRTMPAAKVLAATARADAGSQALVADSGPDPVLARAILRRTAWRFQ